MKTYTLEVVINEGNDEFWENINGKQSSGCDEVLHLLKRALSDYGWLDGDECTVRLVKFEHKEE